jgi:hypothetical protein
MLAQLVLEIRRRASAMGAGTPRALALHAAANEVLEPHEGDTAALPRRVLAALLGMEGGGGFDAAVLDAMTPNVIVLLDIILIALTRDQVAASIH